MKDRSNERTPLLGTVGRAARVSTCQIEREREQKIPQDAHSVNSPCTLAKMTVSPSAPGCGGGSKLGMVHESHTNLSASSRGCLVLGSATIVVTTAEGVVLSVATRFSARVGPSGIGSALLCDLRVSVDWEEKREGARTWIPHAHEVPAPFRREVQCPVELVLVREALVALCPDLLGARPHRVGRVGVEGEGAQRGVGGEEGGAVVVKRVEEPAPRAQSSVSARLPNRGGKGGEGRRT